jgi:transcriptional regulator with XRE-family HTH domain
MYITEEQLKERLNKADVLIIQKERAVRKKVVTDEEGNKIEGSGEKRLDENDRALIGILESIDTQKNIADLVGVSQMTVSNASRGLTSPTIGVDKDLRDKVDEGVKSLAAQRMSGAKQLEDQLLTNLAAALGHVGNNLHNTDAIEASKIAVDMSKILDRVTGNNDGGGKNRTAIIINVPQMKEEKHYKTIEV